MTVVQNEGTLSEKRRPGTGSSPKQQAVKVGFSEVLLLLLLLNAVPLSCHQLISGYISFLIVFGISLLLCFFMFFSDCWLR